MLDGPGARRRRGAARGRGDRARGASSAPTSSTGRWPERSAEALRHRRSGVPRRRRPAPGPHRAGRRRPGAGDAAAARRRADGRGRSGAGLDRADPAPPAREPRAWATASSSTRCVRSHGGRAHRRPSHAARGGARGAARATPSAPAYLHARAPLDRPHPRATWRHRAGRPDVDPSPRARAHLPWSCGMTLIQPLVDRPVLPLTPADARGAATRHASRNPMTCLFRCGNACDHPEPNRTDTRPRPGRDRQGRRHAAACCRARCSAAAPWSSAAPPARCRQRGRGRRHPPRPAAAGGRAAAGGDLTKAFGAVRPNKRDAVVTAAGYTSVGRHPLGRPGRPRSPAFDAAKQSVGGGARPSSATTATTSACCR